MKFQRTSSEAYVPTAPVVSLPADMALFPPPVRKLAEEWQALADRAQDAGDEAEMVAMTASRTESEDEADFVGALKRGEQPEPGYPKTRALQAAYDDAIRRRKALRKLRDEAGRQLLIVLAEHRTAVVEKIQGKLFKLSDAYERALADAERECDRHAQAVDAATDVLSFVDDLDRRARPVGARPSHVARIQTAHARAGQTKLKVLLAGLDEAADPLTVEMTGESGAVFEVPTLTAQSIVHDANSDVPVRIVGDTD